MTLLSRVRFFRLLSVLLLCIPAAFVRPASARAAADLLAPGEWSLSTPHPGDAALEVVPSPDPNGDPTLRVSVKTPSDPFYQIQIARGIRAAVPDGHRLRLRFRARSATRNPIRVTVEKSGPPWTPLIERSATLAPDWQAFDLTETSPGYPADGLSVHFQAGQQAGVVEVTDVQVTDEGIDPALTAAQAALRPAAVQARIEKYRKGTLSVRVVDKNGRAVPGATVRIAQTRHAFLFGCNLFGLDLGNSSPVQAAYRTQFTGLFNYATLPFYWGGFEGVQGKPDNAGLQARSAWGVAHGLALKGHPLVWHEVWPAWAPTDPDAAIPLLHARVADLIPRYQDTIHVWDVLNEANGAAGHTPPNGEGNWIKRDGPAPVVETALGWARDAGRGLPETFLYNDYDTGQSNVALLAQLQKDGKLPDAVGLQSHMHGGEWALTKVWTVCETFARFGRPLHFTETTVISGLRRDNPDNGTLSGWDTTPEGEQRQADYVAQFYTVLFSHPAVRAVTWWDFSDLNAWQGAPAGLVRKDMSPKPAYTRLRDLVRRQWWTNVDGKTDSLGVLKQRVFYGDYAVTVADGQGHLATQEVRFPEAAPPRTVTVRL